MLREGSALKTPRKSSPTCSPRTVKKYGRKSGKTPKSRDISENIEKFHNLAGQFSDLSSMDVTDQEGNLFGGHREVSQRMAKTLYFANKHPSTPRPSLPLTALAVKSYTEILGNADTLDFLDLEMASEIGRNACVTPTALIMALIYLERLSANNPNYIKGVKPSELFVVSLLVASKFIQDDGEDSGIYNDEWATSSNIPLKELNKLEIQFLMALNWNVNMNTKEFMDALGSVERKLALCQGLQRGWFTYTEIDLLFNMFFNWNILGPVFLEYLVKVVAAASMTYTAFLATIISSSLVGPHIFGITQSLVLSTTFKLSQNNYYMTFPGNRIQSQCSSNLNNSCSNPLNSEDIKTDTELPEPVLPMEDDAFVNRYYAKPSYSSNLNSFKESAYQLFSFKKLFEDVNVVEKRTPEMHHELTSKNYTWGLLWDLDSPFKYPLSRAIKCNKLHIM